jgi:hypothetical protein
MTSLPTLPLLMGTISLEDALDDDDNVLPQLRYPGQKKEFWDYLLAHNADIETLVRYHLNIDWCHVCVMETWKSGSFNVCIPVLIPGTGRRRHDKVFVRFPLPYKIGEEQNPGNVEEKLRTEIAAYIWLQKQCPDVSIPTLHGFGLPEGQCVSCIYIRPPLSLICIVHAPSEGAILCKGSMGDKTSYLVPARLFNAV